MQTLLSATLKDGLPYNSFKKALNTLFSTSGLTRLQPYQIQTIHDTNTALAYGAAQQAALIEHQDAFPYWQYSALLDGHTRQEHQALDGKIFKSSDLAYYPPLGFNCRCTAIPMTAEDAKGKGISSANDHNIPPLTNASFIGNKQQNFLNWVKQNYPSHPQSRQLMNTIISRITPKKQKFILDENALNKLKSQGWNITSHDGGIQNFNKHFSKLDLPELTKATEEILKNKVKKIQKKLVLHKTKFSIYFSGDGFSMDRTFERKGNKNYVTHDYLAIPRHLQGSGISKKIISAWYRQYKNANISKIKVYANKDVGGYAWAQYGFYTTESSIFDVVKRNARIMAENGKISAAKRKKINALCDRGIKAIEVNDKPFPMKKISDLKEGKDLLLNTFWDGELNLRNKALRRHFEDYIRRVN